MDKDKQKWKYIKGYRKLYSISSLGNVLAHETGRLKKQSGGKGTDCRYKYVTLYKENIATKIMIHRLVAIHFIPNPNKYPYVLHINDDRDINSVGNLKWGTQKHNHEDSIKNGTAKPPPVMIGVNQPLAKLNPDKIRQIRSIRDSGKSYTQQGLATQFGISRGTLRSILKGNHWKHVL